MDLRVERTYRLLINAFTELMSNKSYDDITVQELCANAMIRRPTFYKHFADKEEFFAFFLKSIRDEFQARVGLAKQSPDGEVPSPEESPVTEMLSRSEAPAVGSDGCGSFESATFMTKQTLSFISDHEQLARNVLSSSKASALIDMIEEVIRLDMLTLIDENAPCDHRILAAFISGGIVNMVKQWWADGMPQNTGDDMATALRMCWETPVQQGQAWQ